MNNLQFFIVNNSGIRYAGIKTDLLSSKLDSGSVVKIYYDGYFNDIEVNEKTVNADGKLLVVGGKIARIRKVEQVSTNLYEKWNKWINDLFGRSN